MSAILVVALIAGSITLLHRPVTTAPTSTPAATAEATTGTAEPSPAATSTSTPQPTATSSGPAGSGGGGVIRPTAPPYGQPIAVQSATMTVDRSSFSGMCSQYVDFNFTLTVTSTHIDYPVAFTYQWLSSEGKDPNIHNFLMFPGETTHDLVYPVHVPASLGNGTQRWVAAEVTGTNAVTTNQAQYSLTCVRQVNGMDGSVTPTSWTGTCTGYQEFDFEFDLQMTHGPDTTVSWTETSSPAILATTDPRVWSPTSGSGTSSLFETFSPGSIGSAYQVVPYIYHYYLTDTTPNGQYSVQLTISGPNNTSATKTVAITKSCS